MPVNGQSKEKNIWTDNPRWKGVTRPYSTDDVERLRGSSASSTPSPAWARSACGNCCTADTYVPALGAMTGNQAVQMVKAGLKAIYVSGWQVAADANDAGQMYPDQSLYPADSVPNLCRRLNNALLRADQIHHSEGQERHQLVRAAHRRRRSRLRRHAQRLRADEGDDRGAAPPASTSRTSSPRPRSAATWAARCWCPRRRRSRSWSRPAWPPTCWACPRCCWRAPTPTAPIC